MCADWNDDHILSLCVWKEWYKLNYILYVYTYPNMMQ